VSVTERGGQVLVTQVAPDGPSSQKLRRGDVILEVDRQAVTGASDLSTRIRAVPAGKAVLLRVKRGEAALYVAVERAEG
jgi:serine protease Do